MAATLNAYDASREADREAALSLLAIVGSGKGTHGAHVAGTAVRGNTRSTEYVGPYLYFWDDPNDPTNESTGWWIAPALGSDEYYAACRCDRESHTLLLSANSSGGGQLFRWQFAGDPVDVSVELMADMSLRVTLPDPHMHAHAGGIFSAVPRANHPPVIDQSNGNGADCVLVVYRRDALLTPTSDDMPLPHPAMATSLGSRTSPRSAGAGRNTHNQHVKRRLQQSPSTTADGGAHPPAHCDSCFKKTEAWCVKSMHSVLLQTCASQTTMHGIHGMVHAFAALRTTTHCPISLHTVPCDYTPFVTSYRAFVNDVRGCTADLLMRLQCCACSSG